MFDNKYNDIREVITSLMLEEVANKSDEYQQNIMIYTAKILSSIENKLNINLKIENNVMLHTGSAPECCLKCMNYKEGRVQICNCTLPYLESFKNMIGD